MDIKEALMQMDALDDDQWTGDGAPKLDVLSEAVGEKVKRQDVIDVAPEFSRENMVVPDDETEISEELEAEASAEADMSKIEAYVEGEPMPEKEMVPFIYDLDAGSLSAFETVLTEQMMAAEEAIQKATDLKLRLKLALAHTRNRIKHEVPDMDNQQAIRAFINSQTASRTERILKTREILKGVDITKLDPRAAIDRAMARKTARGGQRPVRPTKG